MSSFRDFWHNNRADGTGVCGVKPSSSLCSNSTIRGTQLTSHIIHRNSNGSCVKTVNELRGDMLIEGVCSSADILPGS